MRVTIGIPNGKLALLTLAVALSACGTRGTFPLADEAEAPPVTPRWQLAAPLSETDRTLVLRIATQVGIEHPGLIASELVDYPLPCASLRIESPHEASGNRRTWQQIRVTNTRWTDGCADRDPDRLELQNWQ